MKSKITFNLLVCALALACVAVTGCHKKPVGVTPLPGSRVQNPAGDRGTNPFDTSGQNPLMNQPPINSSTMPSSTAMPPGGSFDRFTQQDREKFKSESVYFDYDSSTIKESERSKLETVASYYKGDTSANVALRVEGNCDERGTEEYNRSLGERRAQAIREYLIQSGVSGDRVDTVSYGEDKPMAQGHNEAAWKQNRRGDFVLLRAP